MQPWFLDAVCGVDNWAICMDKTANGAINGVLVYHFVEKWGFKIIKMPTLTPYLTIWLRTDEAWKANYKLSFEKTVLKNLIAQLPSTAFSQQMYPSSFRNWLPFSWAGFQVEPLMKYVLEDFGVMQIVWQNLKDTVRNKIRKAQKSGFSVELGDDIEAFYIIFQKTVNRIGFKTGVTKEMLFQLHAEIRSRDLGKIFFAVDTEGSVLAALYVVWYEKTSIYWIATMDEKAGSSGATSLLVWEVLQELSRRGISRFEATGSMAENLESFISAFGFRQETFWKMTRYGNRFFAFLHFLKKNL